MYWSVIGLGPNSVVVVGELSVVGGRSSWRLYVWAVVVKKVSSVRIFWNALVRMFMMRHRREADLSVVKAYGRVTRAMSEVMKLMYVSA